MLNASHAWPPVVSCGCWADAFMKTGGRNVSGPAVCCGRMGLCSSGAPNWVDLPSTTAWYFCSERSSRNLAPARCMWRGAGWSSGGGFHVSIAQDTASQDHDMRWCMHVEQGRAAWERARAGLVSADWTGWLWRCFWWVQERNNLVIVTLSSMGMHRMSAAVVIDCAGRWPWRASLAHMTDT